MLFCDSFYNAVFMHINGSQVYVRPANYATFRQSKQSTQTVRLDE